MVHGLKIESVQKKGRRVGSVLLLIGLTVLMWGYNWVGETIPLAYVPPQTEKTDIRPLLEQTQTTKQQLDVLSAQTGLHPGIIQRMLSQGKGAILLQIQQRYFADVKVKAQSSTPLTVSEICVDKQGRRTIGMPLVDLQDGDVLVTKNSRFLGWRNGHVALVVDAKRGMLLEAVMLGTKTRLCSVDKWSSYPSFQVLRLKEEYRQVKGDLKDSLPKLVAEYARNNLVEIPYHLLAGIFDEELRGTHCAHLVWYAYKQFGIDLDSDGGLIVTPNDIQNSDYMEKIQTYGY